ncbi:hypothetical protein HDU97_003633 [Phlyctochytrium planicorne]|nr:hypothetical protein HDU97_003633 [Phlyctochytrium planicorne]
MHAPCLLLSALEANNIKLSRLLKALEGELDHVMILRNWETKTKARAPHPATDVADSCCDLHPHIDRLLLLAPPDSVTWSFQDQEPPVNLDITNFSPNDIDHVGDHERRKYHCVYLKPEVVWKQWFRGQYWFLASKKFNLDLKSIQRTAQDSGMATLPPELIAAVTRYLNAEDLLRLEATCSVMFHDREGPWELLCLRDGFASIPGRESEMIEQVKNANEKSDGRVSSFKSLCFCYNSRNRRRLNSLIQWVVDTLTRWDSQK